MPRPLVFKGICQVVWFENPTQCLMPCCILRSQSEASDWHITLPQGFLGTHFFIKEPPRTLKQSSVSEAFIIFKRKKTFYYFLKYLTDLLASQYSFFLILQQNPHQSNLKRIHCNHCWNFDFYSNTRVRLGVFSSQYLSSDFWRSVSILCCQYLWY